MKALRKTLGAACIVLAAAACQDLGPAPVFPFSAEAGRPAAFADAFEVVDTLVLEGGAAGKAAVLFTRFDGERFLVAAPSARQVSVYATDGRLVSDQGGFSDPVSARRTRDGRILVADLPRRLILLSEDAATEPETTVLPLVPMDARDLGGRRYLITGVRLPWTPRPAGNSRPLHLHIWNAMSNSVEKSFFSPPRVAHLDDVASDGEWASTAVRGDTIWAVSQFSDSIFVFGTDGARIGSVSLPLAAQTSSNSPNGTSAEPWSVDSIHLLASGGMVVQLGAQTGTNGPNRYLVIVRPGGAPLAVLADTPMLRVVVGDIFYFEDAKQGEAGRWIAARLRERP